MNKFQRIGAFIAVVLVLVIVLLHSPWEGYTAAYYVDASGNIPDSGAELAFFRCSSNAPIVDWFGSVLHVLVSLFFVGLLYAAWQYFFRTSGNAESEKSSSTKS